MRIVFALAVLAVYGAAFAVTRRPWVPWAVLAVVCTAAASLLVLFTDVAAGEPADARSTAPADASASR
jgi:hypothetical protein